MFTHKKSVVSSQPQLSPSTSTQRKASTAMPVWSLFAALTCLSFSAVSFGATGRSGPTPTSDVFDQLTEVSSNGTANPERLADCPLDTILTGIGARVHHDNVTDLTVHCSRVNGDGSLELDTDFPTTVGGPAEEVKMTAQSGFVVVGAGAVVSKDNVRRIVLRECPWIPATRRTGANCVTRGSDGNPDAELLLDTLRGLSTTESRRNVATGFGMTVSNDNVRVIVMRRGRLR